MQSKEDMEERKTTAETGAVYGLYSAWTTFQNAASSIASTVWNAFPEMPAIGSSQTPIPAMGHRPNSVIDVIGIFNRLDWAPVKDWSYVSGKEVRLFSHAKVRTVELDTEDLAIISEVVLNAALFEIKPKDIDAEFGCYLSASLKNILICNDSEDAQRQASLWHALIEKVSELSKKLAADWQRVEDKKDFPKKLADPFPIVMKKESGIFDGEKIVLKRLVQKLQAEKLLQGDIEVYSFNDGNLYLVSKNQNDMDTFLSHIEPILTGTEKPRAKIGVPRY